MCGQRSFWEEIPFWTSSSKIKPRFGYYKGKNKKNSECCVAILESSLLQNYRDVIRLPDLWVVVSETAFLAGEPVRLICAPVTKITMDGKNEG